MKNPFVFGKVATGQMFTDRESEQERLKSNFNSHINTILISPRRWGKSSLVERVGEDSVAGNSRVKFCYLDLFNIRSEEEFYTHYAKEVLNVAFTRWEERIESAKRLFKRVKPKFTVGAEPATDFTVSFDWEEAQHATEEILDLPEVIGRKKKILPVICLDEFQNIAFFKQPLAFQKKLRAHWQHHTITTYCLYGSKRNMMTELFAHPSMPFYKFGDVMFLEKIPESTWIPFLVGAFERTGKTLGQEHAMRIARTMENHPYFVQQLAHAVWDRTAAACSSAIIDAGIDALLTQNTILFQREIDSLTNSQVNFLRALGRNVHQLSSSESIRSYRLGSSSTVNRVKQALVQKEVVDISGSRIEFMDPLFKLWFTTVYLEK